MTPKVGIYIFTGSYCKHYAFSFCLTGRSLLVIIRGKGLIDWSDQ